MLPTPSELIAQSTDRIASAEVSTGFIVQVWAEAITNPSVHDAANEVYSGAFEFLQDIAGWPSGVAGVVSASLAPPVGPST